MASMDDHRDPLSTPIEDNGPGVNIGPPKLKRKDSGTSSKASGFSNGQDRDDDVLEFLYHRCLQSKWLEPAEEQYGIFAGGASNLGLFLRRPNGTYATEPMSINQDLARAVQSLGVSVAFTMSSEITYAMFQQISPFQTQLWLNPRGFTLPIANSVKDLGSNKLAISRKPSACLCRSEKYVLVWGDKALDVLANGTDVETKLLGLISKSHLSNTRIMSPDGFSTSQGNRQVFFPTGASHFKTLGDAAANEKMVAIQTAIELEGWGDRAYDPERDGMEPPRRPFLLTHAVMISLAMILVIVVEMASIAELITEVRLDGKWRRFALIATIPLFATFSLFFMIIIIGSVFQLFGPLGGMVGNSVFYSATPPKIGRYPDLELPHITIQMPVYKEGLRGVIIPTVTSLLAAIKRYEESGGTASIYINDDGIQLVRPELAEARRAFYELNHIGWCARPPHCTVDGEARFFVRKGKFKKASNMNYSLDFSLRVEDEMSRLIDKTCGERGCAREDLAIEEENELYEMAFNKALERDSGKTWGGGDVLLGEIILLVDSDTRVPEDCLLYAALEMYESPEVALLQHTSGILQIAHNTFENGVAYFTNLIYTSIQFAVGNGDCASFVGHNTFIRRKALQSIAFEEDGRTKFWSESHVSEDFDVSLRLQMSDFVVRLATYHNGGFKEGVSLTVYDELARWEKYAYGCNELVFNPLYKWPTRGPFTHLFRRFLSSNIKITSKVSIIAHIGTYYAIASALPLTMANYFIVGWLQDDVDRFYITSWKTFVGMAVVFNILSPLAYAMLRHRLGQRTFFFSLLEAVKRTPFFFLYFGGISYHVLMAILRHFFGIRMEWTTTAKELEWFGFRIGFDRVVKDFKWMYFLTMLATGGMIYMAKYASSWWTITDFAAIVPLANQIGCHMLLPIALGLF